MSARIVILSRQDRLARDMCDASLECIRVATAYEAAAEMLAAPVSAIVIDLCCLSRRHLRLLRIAGDMDVEVLGVGSLPAGLTAEDLSGVKLAALSDLPRELAKISSATSQMPKAAEAGGMFEPAPPPKPSVTLKPAKPHKSRRPDQPTDETQPARALGELLSAEEISALLEDQK